VSAARAIPFEEVKVVITVAITTDMDAWRIYPPWLVADSLRAVNHSTRPVRFLVSGLA
jgi:hypothetical protein